MPRIGVAGAGAWGTALAVQAANAGHDVCLWGRDAAAVEQIGFDPLEHRAPCAGSVGQGDSFVVRPHYLVWSDHASS